MVPGPLTLRPFSPLADPVFRSLLFVQSTSAGPSEKHTSPKQGGLRTSLEVLQLWLPAYNFRSNPSLLGVGGGIGRGS